MSKNWRQVTSFSRRNSDIGGKDWRKAAKPTPWFQLIQAVTFLAPLYSWRSPTSFEKVTWRFHHPKKVTFCWIPRFVSFSMVFFHGDQVDNFHVFVPIMDVDKQNRSQRNAELVVILFSHIPVLTSQLTAKKNLEITPSPSPLTQWTLQNALIPISSDSNGLKDLWMNQWMWKMWKCWKWWSNVVLVLGSSHWWTPVCPIFHGLNAAETTCGKVESGIQRQDRDWWNFLQTELFVCFFLWGKAWKATPPHLETISSKTIPILHFELLDF